MLLTLGCIAKLKESIAKEYAEPAIRVLEIGCGTGSLAILLAQQGAEVTAIDAAPAMLAEAEKKVKQAGVDEQVTLRYLDASQITDQFEPASFDLIVSTLVFSELPPEVQQSVLAACKILLAPGGHLLVADEVLPKGLLVRLLYYLVRLPLALLTWLLTRTSTTPLKDFEPRGYQIKRSKAYLGGSLVLYEAVPVEGSQEKKPPVYGD